MSDEALRAFRGITVLGFDVVRSSHGFFPHFLVEVTEEMSTKNQPLQNMKPIGIGTTSIAADVLLWFATRRASAQGLISYGS
jgi:hypothetical protein